MMTVGRVLALTIQVHTPICDHSDKEIKTFYMPLQEQSDCIMFFLAQFTNNY